MFFRIFQHLLPRSTAWALTTVKPLRDFFMGLAASLGDVFKLFFDQVYEDLFPQTTRQLAAYEKQFGLRTAVLTEQERRDRLAAAWRAQGGQSPGYIQDTLQAAGFDVYLHEWWVPGSEPPLGVVAAATARNPFAYLTDGAQELTYLSADGVPTMQDGNPDAQDGRTIEPTGYPLVNNLLVFSPLFIGDGSPDMQDGNPASQDGGDGSGGGGNYNLKKYIMPADTNTYPFYLYIGGATFPSHVNIPSSRRSEFETLCLKICPTHVWLGMLIDYS